MLWQIGVKSQSLTRSTVNSDALAFQRVVRAETRRAAIEKVLPEILALDCAEDIRFISVFCGKKGNKTGSAFRLSPVQIDRKKRWFRFSNR